MNNLKLKKKLKIGHYGTISNKEQSCKLQEYYEKFREKNYKIVNSNWIPKRSVSGHSIRKGCAIPSMLNIVRKTGTYSTL